MYCVTHRHHEALESCTSGARINPQADPEQGGGEATAKVSGSKLATANVFTVVVEVVGKHG
eukprot:2702691-Pyramimonas_sp.AAC.1